MPEMMDMGRLEMLYEKLQITKGLGCYVIKYWWKVYGFSRLTLVIWARTWAG